ncbi:MAG: EamA family transporter [Crocinitomicaceae bacterium]|nr:EamA family transporter [Crocinitomicaceae bacterium]
MLQNFKYQILLHFIVFIWGFTAILGEYIKLDSFELVWYRMAIAFASLFLFALIAGKNPFFPDKRNFIKVFSVGAIVGLHWITFFAAIKVSSVSVAVIAMSSSTFFMALLEPLVFKRKIRAYEIMLSLAILFGIFMIQYFMETDEQRTTGGNVALGITLALTSSFLATVFTVINGTFIKKMDSLRITIWEMMGGLLVTSLAIMGTTGFKEERFLMSSNEWIAILILALVCTSFAFLASTWVMKFVTPFTVSISVNMEPIYAMILAILIFPESETMTAEFYIGALIIILAVFLNAFFKSKFSSK